MSSYMAVAVMVVSWICTLLLQSTILLDFSTGAIVLPVKFLSNTEVAVRTLFCWSGHLWQFIIFNDGLVMSVRFGLSLELPRRSVSYSSTNAWVDLHWCVYAFADVLWWLTFLQYRNWLLPPFENDPHLNPEQFFYNSSTALWLNALIAQCPSDWTLRLPQLIKVL
jgi:hypothetical protein